MGSAPESGGGRTDQHPELWSFLKSRRSGEILTGTVASIESFGVFVDVVDGVGGLLHVDELAAIPEVGDEITVVVAEVDRARVRLRLPASSEWLAG